MKKNYIIFFIFFTILFFECKKETLNTIAPNLYTYKSDFAISAATKKAPDIAGIDWIGNIYIRQNKNTKDLLFILSTVSDTIWKYNREEINTNNIPMKTGVYLPTSKNKNLAANEIWMTYYISAADGDAYDGHYVIDENYKSELQIIAIDTITQQIKGTYDLYFVLAGQSPSGLIHPPKVSFLNGKFDTKYMIK
jgi:hypothetical protein